LDAANLALSSTQSNLSALQHLQKSQSHQISDLLQKNNELQTRLADQETAFRTEQTNHERLNKLLEERNEEARRRVLEVESEWDKVINAADEREQALQEKLDLERKKVDALEERLGNLRTVIDRMRSGEYAHVELSDVSHVSGTSGSINEVSTANGSFFSPTATLASRYHKSGKGLTEIYSDNVRLQEELALQKQESKRLEDCLAQILSDIEERVGSHFIIHPLR
jgi:nucleoprotein TPR